MELMIFKVRGATMKVVPYKFFPATIQDLKKMTKFLLQAEVNTEYLQQVTDYLKDRIIVLENDKEYYFGHYEKVKDPKNDIEKFYIDKQNAAVDATIIKINNTLEKLKKNLKYMESL